MDELVVLVEATQLAEVNVLPKTKSGELLPQVIQHIDDGLIPLHPVYLWSIRKMSGIDQPNDSLC